MEKNQTSLHSNQDEDSIDLLTIFKKLWIEKKLIFRTTIISFIVGFLIAIFSPVLYTSQTTFVPQVSDDQTSPSNKLGSLASLAGLKINSNEITNDSYLSPLLYIQIVDSEEFSLELLSAEITNSDFETLTIGEYLSPNESSFNFNPIGFIKKLFSKKETNETNNKTQKKYNFISDVDYNLLLSLRKKYTIELNEKEGFVKVLAKDKDPLISAQLVEQITKSLQSKIIKLRTNKIKERLRFSKEQYQIKQNEFDALHKKLAEFKDSNKNISTATFMSELQKLQSEYELQQSILINLASEYNNNKIKLNKDTPIFSVLDQVSVPNVKSQPNRFRIVFIFIFLGVVLSTSFILVLKEPLTNMIKEITV